MAKRIDLVPNFPVVFYSDEFPLAGWYFRDADDTAYYGPFSSRDQARAFGLKVVSEGIPPDAVSADVTALRRAA